MAGSPEQHVDFNKEGKPEYAEVAQERLTTGSQ